jgi:hypothetical protein
MVRKMLAAAAVMSLFLGTAVGAAPCRDAKTHKFIKCPPPAVVKTTTATKVTATKTTSTTKRCRNAKGQFAKCGTPGAH